MNAVVDLYSLLNEAVHTDPVLLLANAVTWLDPLWQDSLDEAEGENVLHTALLITRAVFPKIYAGAIEQLRSGVTPAAVDHFICDAITEKGIPLDDLEYMSFGIPTPGMGVVLEDPDLYTQRPEVVPILKLFGIHPDLTPANTYSLDVPNDAYKAAQLLVESLKGQADLHWKQGGYSLGWLFGCSGNSLVDYDDETISEFQPLSWETEDITFAVEMFEEARGMLQDADEGIAWLIAQPDMMAALGKNIQRVYKAMQKGKKHEPHVEFIWPTAGDSDGRETSPDSELLQLRVDAA